ncbi:MULTISPECIES: acyl-ACP thioesterase domain-containing protein [Clostridium]|uniref:Acyl-[acyl-carrier-protein] thioesterase n=1 Tax=Clostridium cibarium TaxID=2762247 RepID=A0ABR8PY65_9CLOT|nr:MULTISPECIES: acyl-ACP thioesterase domain-containing protein [Clostridium]MBD7913115.1 acyl-[acyl-carrier-protein] thioesterase [Clostridium cibarium]
MAKSYTKKYEVNYHDSSYKLKCKLSSIVNFLCDVGTNQSEVLGDTIEEMMAKNYAWVFYKYDISMYKYPSYRDVISITTEPIGFNKFYAYRKYYIRSEEGELLGEAVALFFLINLKRRRPMRIPQEQYELYGADDGMNRNIDMKEIRNVEKEDYHKEFNIRYSDIDSNGHVNNVNYLEWAIESVPMEVVKDYEIKELKIIFEKETTYGDTVHVSATLIKEENERLITVHSIKNNEGKEVTKLEATWERE